MNNSKVGLGILSYKRVDQLKKLLETIDAKDFHRVVVHIDRSDVDYSSLRDSKNSEGIEIVIAKRNVGVAKSKNYLLDTLSDCGHIFLLEDDVLIKDQGVFEESIEWSEMTGIKHWSWSNSTERSNKVKAGVNSEIYSVTSHLEASFSYFHESIHKKYKFDEKFFNAFEHIDYHLRVSLDGLVPPFWWFVQPSLLDGKLENQNAESTIDQSEILKDNIEYFKKKHGYHISHYPKCGWRKFKYSLDKIQALYATTQNIDSLMRLRPFSDKKLAIVVTLLNRSSITYTSVEDITTQEGQRFAAQDKMLEVLKPQYENESSFKLNNEAIHGTFTLFRNFLESFRHRTLGMDVVMCVSDWGSTDADVESLLKQVWGEDYRYVELDPNAYGHEDGDFNRGLGLNEAAKLTDADTYFFTDVDCVLNGYDLIEHGREAVEDGAVLFPIFHKEMTPNGVQRYVEWAGNGQCFISKENHQKIGGYPEYWQWGAEDTDYKKKITNAGITVFVDDYPELIHCWHSDLKRDTK